MDRMTKGEEEDCGDEADCLLAKKEPDHIAIWILRNSVHGEGETKYTDLSSLASSSSRASALSLSDAGSPSVASVVAGLGFLMRFPSLSKRSPRS